MQALQDRRFRIEYNQGTLFGYEVRDTFAEMAAHLRVL